MKLFGERTKGIRRMTLVSTAVLVVGTASLLAVSQGPVAAVPLDAVSARGAAIEVPVNVGMVPGGGSVHEPSAVVDTPMDATASDTLVSEAAPDTASLGIYCCSSGSGACVMLAGGCPSGTASTPCPCLPPV